MGRSIRTDGGPRRSTVHLSAGRETRRNILEDRMNARSVRIGRPSPPIDSPLCAFRSSIPVRTMISLRSTDECRRDRAFGAMERRMAKIEHGLVG